MKKQEYIYRRQTVEDIRRLEKIVNTRNTRKERRGRDYRDGVERKETPRDI